MNSNLHINFDPTYPLGQDEGRLERIDLHVLPVHFKETAAFFFRHHIVLIHDPKEQAHAPVVQPRYSAHASAISLSLNGMMNSKGT